MNFERYLLNFISLSELKEKVKKDSSFDFIDTGRKKENELIINRLRWGKVLNEKLAAWRGTNKRRG